MKHLPRPDPTTTIIPESSKIPDWLTREQASSKPIKDTMILVEVTKRQRNIDDVRLFFAPIGSPYADIDLFWRTSIAYPTEEYQSILTRYQLDDETIVGAKLYCQFAWKGRVVTTKIMLPRHTNSEV